MEFLKNRKITVRVRPRGIPPRRPSPRCATRWLALLLSLVGLPPLKAQVQPAASLEYQVKAAFLLNFTRFIEWPAAAFPAADTPITICIVGTDPFGPALDRMVAGESVNGRAVRVQRHGPQDNLRMCHVAFISVSNRADLANILSNLQGASVLTVSDLPQFSERGGMIEFTLQEGKVRFYIQAAVARSAGLTLSSRLLRLALPPRRAQR